MLSVRRATIEDFDAMVAIYTAAWRDGFRHMFSSATFARSDFDADRRAECGASVLAEDSDTYVAQHHGHVVAWGVATRVNPVTSVIEDLWVHPSNWGSGAAAAIVSKMEDDARSNGIGRLACWIPEDSPRARKFAEKIGWRPTGEVELLAVYDHEPNRVFEYERSMALFDMTRGLPRPVG